MTVGHYIGNMSNEYHVLSFQPTLKPKKLGKRRENLAQRLVQSGKLRIKTDTQTNFVNKSGSDYERSFSYRELTDPKLQDVTRVRIADLLPGAVGEAGIIQYRQMLIDKLKPIRNLPEEREMEVARYLTQACEPEVMEQVLIDGCEVFVSYAHNVADLMAVHFWEERGTSSGLQAISGDGTAVYVSCGGNPFVETDEQKTFTTDGFPALARFMVIAGQELGHFADILRNPHGGVVMGRHSASLQPLRASAKAKKARDADMRRVQDIQKHMQRLGVQRIAAIGKRVTFYKEKRGGLFFKGIYYLVQGFTLLWMRGFAAMLSPLLASFPRTLYHEYKEGLADMVLRCVRDMQFNLAPDAAVYVRPDPRETEAIACIEALARVPQQVNKWGHKVTRFCWPALYHLYYEEVIPSLRAVQKQKAPH